MDSNLLQSSRDVCNKTLITRKSGYTHCSDIKTNTSKTSERFADTGNTFRKGFATRFSLVV